MGFLSAVQCCTFPFSSTMGWFRGVWVFIILRPWDFVPPYNWLHFQYGCTFLFLNHGIFVHLTMVMFFLFFIHAIFVHLTMVVLFPFPFFQPCDLCAPYNGCTFPFPFSQPWDFCPPYIGCTFPFSQPWIFCQVLGWDSIILITVYCSTIVSSLGKKKWCTPIVYSMLLIWPQLQVTWPLIGGEADPKGLIKNWGFPFSFSAREERGGSCRPFPFGSFTHWTDRDLDHLYHICQV